MLDFTDNSINFTLTAAQDVSNGGGVDYISNFKVQGIEEIDLNNRGSTLVLNQNRVGNSPTPRARARTRSHPLTSLTT